MKKLLLLVFLLFAAACNDTPAKDRAIGQYVSVVFVIDAPSGKCVKIQPGDNGYAKVVDPKECK